MPTLTVIATTAIEENLLGVLTRWTVRPMPGVFVGSLSARVRDRLWDLLSSAVEDTAGYATLIHPAANEQGYSIRTAGRNARRPIDYDGLTLLAWPRKSVREAGSVALVLPF